MDEKREVRPQVTLPGGTKISEPIIPEGLAVDWDDWDFVKTRLGKCKPRLDMWGALASFFFSGFLFAWGVLLAGSIETIQRPVFSVIAWAMLIGSVLSVLARVTASTAQSDRIEGVLEDMKRLERKYPRPTPRPSPTPVSPSPTPVPVKQ